jgi:hypothetical protein
MNARLALLLTEAHAPAWRRRYGAEFCALLEDLPATPGVLASATTSAFASRSRALAALGAFALAAALLALGPAASDHNTVAAHASPPHTIKATTLPNSNAPCDGTIAHVATAGAIRC